MANLNFWIKSSPSHCDYVDLISRDLDGFEAEQWFPVQARRISDLKIFPKLSHAIEANGREVKYINNNSYFDDYYNRIHIAPASLELGNVASEQVSQIILWNAYLIPKTLLSIDGLQEGLLISGQSEAPLKFTALQERSWNLSILPDGPSTIEAILTWNFGTDLPNLKITGTRIVAFGWLIDWAKPVVETLQWLTDILQSQTGFEQRRSLRITPNMSFEVELLLYETERQYFDLVMMGWSAKTFAIPIWHQQQWLKTAHQVGGFIIYCDTSYRNFKPNRLAILRGQTAFDNETVEIETVLVDRLILKRPLQKSWSKGTCLSPAVTAQIDQSPQLLKRTNTMMRTQLKFNVTEPVDHIDSMPSIIYRNFPVLIEKPNEQQDLTHSYERLMNVIENKTGFALKTDFAKAAFGLYQYEWMTVGRQQQAKLRALFYALRGCQKAIWLPTFSSDLTVKRVITANSQTLDILWCGYTRFAQKQLGRQDIQITLRDGTTLYRRIISAAEVDNTTERLAVDQSFINQINVKDIINISFMSLCRLSNDSVSFQHINDSDGIAKASATFRGVQEN